MQSLKNLKIGGKVLQDTKNNKVEQRTEPNSFTIKLIIFSIKNLPCIDFGLPIILLIDEPGVHLQRVR